MEFVSINPATGQELGRYPTVDDAGVEAALEAASTGSARWRDAPIEQRAQVLVAAARLLESEADKLAALMSVEMGKPYREARSEAQKSAWVCRHYAEHGAGFLADEPAESDGQRAWIRYEPRGAILGIMPWNFPFWQVFRMAAPALLAGNVVLIKHAPSTPRCAEAVATIWRRAGAPKEVYQDLRVDLRQVEGLIHDRRVAAVTLTGSTRAGAAVAAIAGAALKKTILELGGSDPCVVMPSADLEQAVNVGLRSRVLNNGQSCVAAKRFIVHEDIADAFEARFVEAMAALSVGDPMDDDVDVGPIASEALRDHLAEQVRQTVEAGATVRLGGEVPRGPGFFYPPTVLTHVPEGTPAWKDELFGPVASILRVPDLATAITVANGTDYGLGASAWTTDEAEADTLVRRLEAGSVVINGMVKSDPRLPFGGIKRSGYGRELGRHGIRELCYVKSVWTA
ncbi:MAG: NADP-dependent succinic semialdehyde dehydrogenase [Proteobacteria bacterium]|nr:MAG: NADP-dependent succinic semialdehyde dehydrogenase [Pseudomonadota bacterium]